MIFINVSYSYSSIFLLFIVIMCPFVMTFIKDIIEQLLKFIEFYHVRPLIGKIVVGLGLSSFLFEFF